MLKIAALVSGGGTNLQAIIDAIESGQLKNVEIAAVASTNLRAYALERAKKYDIPTAVFAKKDFASAEDREELLVSFFQQHGVGLVVLCGSLMVLGKKVLEVYENRIINIHPALLPNFGGKGYYGLAVHEAVLASGMATTGATVHFVDEGIDTGRIILQKEVAVLPGDTPETLQRRVMEEAEWQILPQAIGLLAERGLNL
ncbi:MAG: phosphoribosylglycinamide formyltransferase [Defluviitaleaceae bacterium]|nr:phosphoribosylglycinamide formyltransferase [Defluviitaleaceae bacterium]